MRYSNKGGAAGAREPTFAVPHSRPTSPKNTTADLGFSAEGLGRLTTTAARPRPRTPCTMVDVQDPADTAAARPVANPVTDVQGVAAAGAQVDTQRHAEEDARIDADRRRAYVPTANFGPEGMPSLLLSLLPN